MKRHTDQAIVNFFLDEILTNFNVLCLVTLDGTVRYVNCSLIIIIEFLWTIIDHSQVVVRS